MHIKCQNIRYIGKMVAHNLRSSKATTYVRTYNTRVTRRYICIYIHICMSVLVYFGLFWGDILYFCRCFGIFYCHLALMVAILVYFFRVGLLCHKKCGNTEQHCSKYRARNLESQRYFFSVSRRPVSNFSLCQNTFIKQRADMVS
jgi:hypothetical protein